MAEKVEQTIDGQKKLLQLGHELRTPITRLRLRAEIESKNDSRHRRTRRFGIYIADFLQITKWSLAHSIHRYRYQNVLYEVLANAELMKEAFMSNKISLILKEMLF